MVWKDSEGPRSGWNALRRKLGMPRERKQIIHPHDTASPHDDAPPFRFCPPGKVVGS
jgi:hypothetical protein